jgi:hypothetical protein
VSAAWRSKPPAREQCSRVVADRLPVRPGTPPNLIAAWCLAPPLYLPWRATIKGATLVTASPFPTSLFSFLRTPRAPSFAPSTSCPPRSTEAPPPLPELRSSPPPLQPHGEPCLRAFSHRSELLLTSPFTPSSCRTLLPSMRATGVSSP